MGNFKMKEHTHTALKNAAFNFVGYIYPMLLAFIVAPVTVKSLGVREYGLYVFISTILSLMGLLDLGVSTAVSRFLTKYHATDSRDKIAKLTGSANSIFLIVGIIGFLIFSSVGIFGHLIISPSLINYSNYPAAFVFAGLLFLTTSISSIYLIAPNALGRFDLSNKVGLFVITLQQIGIIAAVLLHYSIATIFIIQFIIAILGGILNRHVSKKILPYLSFSFAWDKKEIINFYKFGLTVFMNNITGSSLTYLDRIIIPFFLGPSNLTYYSLPGNVTSKTPGIANTLSGTIFPMAAHFESLGDMERVKTLYKRSTRLLLVMSTSITVAMVSYSYEMLRFWISRDVADKASEVLVILAFTSLVLAILSPISNLLLGLGKLKSLTIASVAMSITNAILLFILIPRFGIIGAAWAYLLSLAPVLWLIYRVEINYLNLGKERLFYYFLVIPKLLMVSLLTYALNFYIFKNLVTSLITLAIFGPLSIIMFLLLYRIFGFFEKEDTADIKKFLGRIVKLLK